MFNLAGHKDPDPIIERELKRCRIDIIRGDKHEGEVATTITGCLGEFTFRRFWRYWVVDGRVPLEIAARLYSDPVGETDIRVGGDCGCPSPQGDYLVWLDDENHWVLPLSQKSEAEQIIATSQSSFLVSIARQQLQECRFSDEPATIAKGYILIYHIDSEVGLRVFADAVREIKP